MAATDAVEGISLGHGDITEALKLSDEAGWNQVAADWAVFMDHGRCFGFRVEGRLVATAAVLPFGGGFGWISMVLVTADWRRRGLASDLLSRCIETMRTADQIALLDATPAGALVYARFGFRTACGMSRWRGDGLAVDPAPIEPGLDAVDLVARDCEAFGGDRGFLLRGILGREGSVAIGDARNFVLLRQGRHAVQIGPLVADTARAALELFDAALSLSKGPVIIDVLDAGAALGPLLTKRGFRIVRTFERMVLDGKNRPGEHAAVMAAAGPEFG